MLDFFANSQFAFSAVLMLAVIAAMMTTVAYSIYFERKIAAWIQDRRGPNRVGFFGLFGNFHFWGLGQPIADGLKFLLKEDIIPARVDRPVYLLAPVMVFLVAMIGFAVIPWGGSVDLNGDGTVDVVAQVANPDIGLLYLLGDHDVAAVGATLFLGVVVHRPGVVARPLGLPERDVGLGHRIGGVVGRVGEDHRADGNGEMNRDENTDLVDRETRRWGDAETNEIVE